MDDCNEGHTYVKSCYFSPTKASKWLEVMFDLPKGALDPAEQANLAMSEDAKRDARERVNPQPPITKRDLDVLVNGYLALFREHERDIRLMRYAMRGLVLLVLLQFVLLMVWS